LGFAVLVVSLANMAWPSNGQNFPNVMASIYPGFHPNHTLIQAVIGTLCAIVDGLIGGTILSWLYNRLAKAD
jgi:hypothetical protein